MMDVLADTNVVVYVEDDRDPWKQRQAMGLWRTLTARPGTFVSSQVVSESASTALRLWRDPLKVDRFIAKLENSATVVPVMPSTVRLAIDGCARFGFSFYDAQVWASAREWGASVVLSEDFPDGLVADGVRFADPFAPGFDLEALLA
ncbi:MAG: PIN domain-containing protein [Actinobacteria bacterium]|nr:PIN domain-containing protein [Actinomycetota bacterium]